MNYAYTLKQRKINAIKPGVTIKNSQHINIFPPMGEYKQFNIFPDTELTVKTFNPNNGLITISVDTSWQDQPRTIVSLDISDIYLA
jgi:hypothetical protein